MKISQSKQITIQDNYTQIVNWGRNLDKVIMFLLCLIFCCYWFSQQFKFMYWPNNLQTQFIPRYQARKSNMTVGEKLRVNNKIHWKKYFWVFSDTLISFSKVSPSKVSAKMSDSPITNNISDQFPIQRGLKQGNSISGYLFVCCIEILIMLI